jgi:hypothetical protein
MKMTRFVPWLFVISRSILGNDMPVFDIKTTPESRDNFLEGSLDGTLAQKTPYAARAPKPFLYKEDVNVDGKGAFVVGGVNPSSRLKNVQSLTGVAFDTIQLRMLGSGKGARDPKGIDLAWKGMNNIGMRRSNDGFLKQEETFRQRLIADNNTVFNKGLTHQKIVEPLFAGIEAYEKAQAETQFEFAGKRYTIKGGRMGGEDLFFELLPKNDPRRKNHSGWVGFGMQGSPFRDEVFAQWYFEIRKLQGELLRGDALTTQLIHRYGFYQGGKYRMDPIAIIKFFDLHP